MAIEPRIERIFGMIPKAAAKRGYLVPGATVTVAVRCHRSFPLSKRSSNSGELEPTGGEIG